MDDNLITNDFKDKGKNYFGENWEDCDGTERDPMMFLYQKFLKGKKFHKWCRLYYDLNMEHCVTNMLDPKIFFCAKSCVVELKHLCDIPIHDDIVRNVSEMAINEMFWILRNCLVLKKLVVKEHSQVNAITAQQFFSQMTKRNENFRNCIESLEVHYNDYDHQIERKVEEKKWDDKILLFLQKNKTVKDISLIGKNFGDIHATKLAWSYLESHPAISFHLKDDAITFKGFSRILRLNWNQRDLTLRFEIPLSKEILNFLLIYFKDEEDLDISYFELIQYGGFNEMDKNTEECRKLLGDLRVNLVDWIGVSSYKFNGFGVTFDSDERFENMLAKFIN